MSHAIERWLVRGARRKWREDKRRRLRNRVIEALTLAPRGAVANDGLQLRQTSLALEVEWQARPVHPWDGDLPIDRRAELFTTTLMVDTVVAIQRMFERLAEVDVLQIRVLAPHQPEQTVLAGTVCREDVDAAQGCLSPVMSLKRLGVEFRPPEGSV